MSRILAVLAADMKTERETSMVALTFATVALVCVVTLILNA